MSYFVFGNLPESVPPVMDTTPCMDQMLNYEDCILDARVPQLEVIHPNWPTMYPRLLTDGKLVELDPENPVNFRDDQYSLSQQEFCFKMDSLKASDYDFKYLWECEEERFVYKSCLRKVIGLKKTDKMTSWNTAEVSNLQLTQAANVG